MRPRILSENEEIDGERLFYQMMSVLFHDEMKKYPKRAKEHFLKRFRREAPFPPEDTLCCASTPPPRDPTGRGSS